MGGASGAYEFKKAPEGNPEEGNDVHARISVLPEKTDGIPILQTELLLSDRRGNRERHGHTGREPCGIAEGLVAFGRLPLQLAHYKTEKLALCLGYTL